MLQLITNPQLDLLLSIIIGLSFPASLYIWGFWQRIDRNDIRVIARRTISITMVSLLTMAILFFSIDLPFSLSSIFTRFQYLLHYIGLDLINAVFTFNPIEISKSVFFELKIIIIGLIIVNMLFIGSLVQNIGSFIIERNHDRSYAIAFTSAIHKPSSTATTSSTTTNSTTQSNNNKDGSTTKPMVDLQFPRYQTDPFSTVALYELTHWSDIIESAQITPLTPIQYFTTLITKYWSDIQLTVSHFMTSLDFKHVSDVAFVIEYDTISNLRGIIISPFFEEVVFRGILYPFLFHYTNNNVFSTVMYSALLFASVHLHHFFQHKENHGVKTALIMVTVQWLYCFAFALFCGYLYSLPYIMTSTNDIIQSELISKSSSLSTQPLFSLLSSIICHAICNMYGLPDTDFLTDKRHRLHGYKFHILALYIGGIIGFGLLLYTLPAQ